MTVPSGRHCRGPGIPGKVSVVASYLDAPRLVEDGHRHYGRFLRTPIANPYDARPLSASWRDVPTLTRLVSAVGGFVDEYALRAYEWFRTKEWVGFTLIHPELFGSMIIQDAKYLASSELYVYDRETGGLTQHAANRMGGSLRLPADLLHRACAFDASKNRPLGRDEPAHDYSRLSSLYRLGYAFDADEVVVAIDIDASESGPGVHGRLDLDPRRASAPLAVSARLPGGSLYTNKIVYPASGVITCGERRYVFDPDRDFAILDEHKSHLPYRTRWTWGTFAMRTPDGIAGANFATRPSVPGQEEESCVWTPDAAEPLSDVAFTPLGDGDDAPWRIRSTDGRLDVVFTPEGRKGVDQFLIAAELHYVQRFGHYDGTLTSAAGTTWTVDGVHGVCEQMDARL